MSTIPTLEQVEDRDQELRIRGHLAEIAELNDEVIGNRQGFPMAKEGYKWTLSAVALCADSNVVDQVAEYIKSRFQAQLPERPSNQKVRRNAKRIVRKQEYDPHPFLNV